MVFKRGFAQFSAFFSGIKKGIWHGVSLRLQRLVSRQVV